MRAQARQLIAAFADRGHCEVMADLGRLFPTQVFLTIYGLTCIALPLQLKRQAALSAALLVTAILAGISMVMALAGTLYPVPAAPYSWLPYLYFVYLLITLVFFFRTRQKRGAAGNGMDNLS